MKGKLQSLKENRSLYDEGEEVLGSTIQVQGVVFTVVEVLVLPKGRTLKKQIRVCLSRIRHLKSLSYRRRVGWYSLLIDPALNADSAKQSIIDLMKVRKSVHPDDNTAFGSWTMASCSRG